MLYTNVKAVLELELNAVEKFETMFQSAASWKSENVAAMKPLLKIMISGYGQSYAPVMRNTSLFDSTHPKISLYVEAVK